VWQDKPETLPPFVIMTSVLGDTKLMITIQEGAATAVITGVRPGGGKTNPKTPAHPTRADA
jgi:hypothetical protein